MKPTTRLRFVERYVYEPEARADVSKKVRILQQWWAVEREGQMTPTGEWRDVPLENEE
jgi:sulfur carrier protein ThiS